MKPRNIEKSLFKVAAFLVVIGALVRFFSLTENGLGLYLILFGHVVGVAAILMYMKYVNDREREKEMQECSEKQFNHR